MTKDELIERLQCKLFATAKNLEEAQQVLNDVIEDLPKDYKGDMWLAIAVFMNTLAAEIEELEDDYYDEEF